MILKKIKEELFDKEKYYSLLTDRKNSLEKFEMKTIKDYHRLHLKCDVLLLFDVFEKCRNNSLKNYGLYPSYYLSTPGLSWDAMLKREKFSLN